WGEEDASAGRPSVADVATLSAWDSAFSIASVGNIHLDAFLVRNAPRDQVLKQARENTPGASNAAAGPVQDFFHRHQQLVHSEGLEQGGGDLELRVPVHFLERQYSRGQDDR